VTLLCGTFLSRTSCGVPIRRGKTTSGPEGIAVRFHRLSSAGSHNQKDTLLIKHPCQCRIEVHGNPVVAPEINHKILVKAVRPVDVDAIAGAGGTKTAAGNGEQVKARVRRERCRCATDLENARGWVVGAGDNRVVEV